MRADEIAYAFADIATIRIEPKFDIIAVTPCAIRADFQIHHYMTSRATSAGTGGLVSVMPKAFSTCRACALARAHPLAFLAVNFEFYQPDRLQRSQRMRSGQVRFRLLQPLGQ